MTIDRIAHAVAAVIILICALYILSALSDLHCTLLRPGDATFVLACRASRLEAVR
jgi:hypothetical protein